MPDSYDESAPERDSLTVEGHHFALVPEWLIDADIGDCAFRLYAVLLRYGQSSGRRMPSRATLAKRLRKRSVDTVDRAMKELVGLGAVTVERRRSGRQNLTNLYHVRTSAPGRTAAATSLPPAPGRSDAATCGREAAATCGRTRAARVTEGMRHNPEDLTQRTPPPAARHQAAPWTEEDLQALSVDCQRLRRDLGMPVGLWTASCLSAAAARALDRGWPAEHVLPALRRVAADPATRSPMRVAEAGPWWDKPAQAEEDGDTHASLAVLEARLDALDGHRLGLQRQARAELQAEGLPLTRATVLRRAVDLLDRRGCPIAVGLVP